MNPLGYARLAARAYTEPPMIGLQDNSARAIIERTDDGVALAFPGTNNIACWLADLDVQTIHIDGLGILHNGFWQAMKLISADCWRALEGGGPFVLVGHSEGAALALVFAGYCCLFGRPPAAVYAFEAPRVSIDGGLAGLLAKNGVVTLIYRNGKDVVPLVPRLLHDWQHPAALINIGTPALPFDNIEDHAIERVILALSSLA